MRLFNRALAPRRVQESLALFALPRVQRQIARCRAARARAQVSLLIRGIVLKEETEGSGLRLRTTQGGRRAGRFLPVHRGQWGLRARLRVVALAGRGGPLALQPGDLRAGVRRVGSGVGGPVIVVRWHRAASVRHRVRRLWR